MRNIFLAPRASETAYENFESTILKGREYSFVEPYLDNKQKNVLSKYSSVSIWGNKESLRSRWEKMEHGDYVLFYASGKFYYSARIILTKFSTELGIKLWPIGEDGKPWPCLFFVDNLKEVSIPIQAVQELAEYEPTWDRVQGFMRLNDKGIESIVDKFGSIESFINQKPETLDLVANVLENSKSENIEGEIRTIDKEDVLKSAQGYIDTGKSHAIDSTPRKRRIENKKQKERVAQLEDYKCQVCNWSLEWTDSKKKKRFRIDIDHIVDKAKGGGEELSNLWALCPNCHTAKTLGVIRVDKEKGKVFRGEKELKLHHDSHLDW
nr:HNH endonuclease [Candidatus Undinarchaeales archaeon ERR594346 U_76725]